MKHVSKLILTACILTTFLVACDKVGELPLYNAGTVSELSASADAIEPVASDSLSDVLSFAWTNPGYASDSSTFKYVVQIDAAGNNFANPASHVVNGELTTSFTGKEINTYLLNKGYSFGVAYNMEARVISSYANNNEQLFSNVLSLQMTPYKIPPKVQLPSSGKLFITGGATDGGWQAGNGVGNPLPYQEFVRIDETTFGGIFHLKGGDYYLLLPVDGSWDAKYALQNNSVAGISEGGDFGFNAGSDFNSNFPSPATEGWYKITVDFQMGKFTVVSVANAVPQQLYITGDATQSSWTNTPPESQKFTGLNSCEFELTMAFEPGKYYKFLSAQGSWQPQFGGSAATGGDLGANYGGGSDPNAVPTPDEAGNYKVWVNFFTEKYTVTKQ